VGSGDLGDLVFATYSTSPWALRWLRARERLISLLVSIFFYGKFLAAIPIRFLRLAAGFYL